MTWFSRLRKRFFSQPAARRPIMRDRMRLNLERLEDRTLLDAGLPTTPVADAPGSDGHFINNLYEVLLSRTPSQGEVKSWTATMAGGLTPAQTVARFLGSPEYRADVVQEGYLKLLGRQPESGATGAWIAAMEHGLTDEQFTERLLASPEYYAQHGQNNASWLNAVYNDVLSRAPDGPGLASWTNTLDHGASRQVVAQGFVLSAEARAEAVMATYGQLLARSPESQALQSWAGAFGTGLSRQQFIARVAESNEFIQRMLMVDGSPGVLSPIDPTVSSTEGSSNTNTQIGSFTDSDGTTDTAGTYSISVAWGDGNTSSGFATSGGGNLWYVNGTHAYAEEGSSYNISATVTDLDDNSTTTVTATGVVADAALSGQNPPTSFATQGTSLSATTAVFTDADIGGTPSDYYASISWGDGSAPTAGTVGTGVGGFGVTGTHAYQETGTYNVLTTITDAGGSQTTSTTSFIVSAGSNPAPPPMWPPSDGAATPPGAVPGSGAPGSEPGPGSDGTPPGAVPGSGSSGSDPGSGSDPTDDLIEPEPGSEYNTCCGDSTTGVRYADGEINFSADFLKSEGFGSGWSLPDSWSNNSAYSLGASSGSGMSVSTLPYLESLSSGATLVVITNGAARYFDQNGSGYTARYDEQDVLTHNTANNEFVLTDTRGAQIRFNDFSGNGPANANGKFKSYTDPYDNVTQVTSYNSAGQVVEVQRQSTVGSTTIVESYHLSYLSSGVNSGLMSSGALRRQTNGGSWSTVRQVAFTYYDGTQSYGNAGDLMLAQVEDASSNVLDTYYYRYYVPTDTGGYTHGLKYFFTPEAYARLTAAYSTPGTATDSQVAPDATAYLQYDSSHRVSQLTLAGAGASANNGGIGLGTYSYSYTASSNTVAFNSWAVKTTETLPDGNQNVVYTNAFGEIMLKVFESGGQNWEGFHKYDGQGRVILTAAPSALTGWDDTKADLLNSQSGSYQYMSNSAGLVTVTDYYASTTAGETTAGGVAGYVQDHKIQQGQTGTPILLDSVQYFGHAADGITVGAIAGVTVYRNTDGTGAETTSFSYTWFSGTAGVQSETTTLATISSSQNGPGSADVSVSYFSALGQLIWHKDADGFLSYVAYDQATGAVVKTIADVNTANTSDFTVLPSGWSTPSGAGLHLITTIAVDALGRHTQVTDPAGNTTYTVYNDTNYEVLVYPGWNTSTNAPTGPTQVTREDRANSYLESLTMAATPHLTSGKPDGTEAIGSVQTLSRAYTDAAGQVVIQDAYFNLSGLTYSTAAAIGTVNVNYYRTTLDYDADGRQNRVVHPTGTIDRTVFDALGRPASTWVGTNDTPTNGYWSPTNNTGSANMVQLTADVYDGGNVGDGNLTQQTVYPGGSAPNRVSQFFFDWRDRQVASKAGVQPSEDTTTHRPIIYTTYDNLNEPTLVQHFDGDGATITTTNGVPVAPSSSLLRAEVGASYDNQGRVYQTQVYSVNQSTGAVSTYALTTNTYFNHRGLVMATSAPGGLWTKNQYDGAGRVTVVYQTDGAAGTSWSQASAPTSDNVLEQDEKVYDADGNAIETVTRQRNHDEAATGALGNETTTPKARVYYAAAYYDQANRLTGTVDVGTNAASAWTRPSSLPSASDTQLVTTYAYSSAGWVNLVTDPRGIETQTTDDALGRTTQTIADYTDGTPTSDTNVTTQYTYDGDGHTLTLSALLTGGAYETTQFVYGVTTAAGSDVNSNDLLAKEEHPDKSTGAPSTSEQDVFTVNALGETKTATDRNGTVHTFTRDVLGRLTADGVTTLGSGVDGAVRRIETAYNSADLAYLFTSYDAASGGNVVNQIQDVFNGLGQFTQEYQSHSGAVNTSATPSVQYAYTEMAGGVNNSRPITLTYPNGRAITYNYASGVDTSISRLSSISDGSTTLESYAYLGLDTVVKRAHPQSGVDLTYIKQSGESNGDAGDQYTGLDRFGRVVDQRWIVTSTGTATDRFQYGYDRDGNVLYKNNLVNSSFSELYHPSGAGNGYDALNQLQAFSRGVLSASSGGGGVLDTISSPSHSQSWTPDPLGNFSSVTTDGTPVSRTNNKQNEVTAVGGNTLGFDNNGNLTTDDHGYTFIYDAWNRLVQAKNGPTVLTSYAYDALGRRITENPGTQRDLYYSTQWQALEERVGGAAQEQYVWSPIYLDALVERDRDPTGSGTLSERLYVQQDADWNVTAVVNTSGTVVERYVEDPFGQPAFLTPNWSSESASTLGWVYLQHGLRWDAAVALMDGRQRVQSPSLGRWLQADSLGMGFGDPNRYRYAHNAPTSRAQAAAAVPAKKNMQEPIPLTEDMTSDFINDHLCDLFVDFAGTVCYGFQLGRFSIAVDAPPRSVIQQYYLDFQANTGLPPNLIFVAFYAAISEYLGFGVPTGHTFLAAKPSWVSGNPIWAYGFYPDGIRDDYPAGGLHPATHYRAFWAADDTIFVIGAFIEFEKERGGFTYSATGWNCTTWACAVAQQFGVPVPPRSYWIEPYTLACAPGFRSNSPMPPAVMIGAALGGFPAGIPKPVAPAVGAVVGGGIMGR
jgi:RHS repeat-associated protein